ncbi:alpha/beta hydrolase [Sphingobacterium corticis]|uniref:Alpha/beta hydrolase n=1 Tax=Sphingobacterium corticis TaxID=1812823 RepID=A0ABW5NL93_9SPHI
MNENNSNKITSKQKTIHSSLEKLVPSFHTVFPNTHYFEIDSESAGNRFSAFVTLPATYADNENELFPVVYQLDANIYFPSTAPFHLATHGDIMSTLRPFILVSIGYSEQESQEWDWLRVRDLVPPEESVPEIFYQTLDASVQAGLVSQEKSEIYREMFGKPAGDKFLSFLENELHPHLEEAYRIDKNDAGIWGFSYGGLFTSYVALKKSELFKYIGAGSPGIVGNDSSIYKMYDESVSSKKDYSGRHLHITLGARELADFGPYQWLTARGTSELIAKASQFPLSGMRVTSELIPLETHLTGGVSSWFSFLRTCYAKK